MHHRLTKRFHQLVSIVALSGLTLSSVRAAECPESSPEDPQLRRKYAKEWFSNAEAAENSNDNAEAVRAYACSYKMVAHPFTAYNLARVAERAENLELSLKMYKAYLALKPDATDKAEVSDKVKVLEEKLKDATAETPTEPTPPPAIIEEPAPEPLAPPPVTPPRPIQPVVEDRADEDGPSKTLLWVVGGVSAASLLGGILLNVAARGKMDSCRSNSNQQMYLTANDQCNAAVPLAYMSYALFGVATAGAVVDGILLLRSNSSKPDDIQFSLQYMPGGAGLMTRGRF